MPTAAEDRDEIRDLFVRYCCSMRAGGLVISGRHEDDLRRVDGRWVIAKRRFTPDAAS